MGRFVVFALFATACSSLGEAPPASLPPPPPGYWAVQQPPVPAAMPRAQVAAVPPALPAIPRTARTTIQLWMPAGAKRSGEERLTVELRDQGGRSVWRCERTSPLAEGSLTDWCPLREPLKAGNHLAEARFRSSSKAAESVVTQSFGVTLEELGFELDVRLAGGEPLRLDELVVSRVLPAHPEVQLKREGPNANPATPLRYVLANGSPTHTLYVSGIQGIAIGTLDRASESGWVSHTRGIVCGVEHTALTVAPGASVFTEEGHFVGPLRALDEGHYRMRLRYTLSPEPAPAAVATPRALLRQVHEVYDEVEISTDRLEPVEDIRDPFSCNPPFRVDLDGVRHIKPECLGY